VFDFLLGRGPALAGKASHMIEYPSGNRQQGGAAGETQASKT
jgi:hypothetical protein